MKAFKAFHKNMTCTLGKGTFRYKIGETYTEDRAQAHQTGFHCAEYVLDCLSYYRLDNCRICEVEAEGDIDEDGRDSKIACTKITIIRELSIEEIVFEAMKYQAKHPRFADNKHTFMKKAYGAGSFVIVRGKNPVAAGELGTVLGIIQEKQGSRVVKALGIYTIDGEEFKENTYYDVEGKEAGSAKKSRTKRSA